MEKQDILRLRVEDPYTIFGICLYLSEHEYLVSGLYIFNEINLKGFIRCCQLNKWIDIFPKDRTVIVENGNESFDDCKLRENPFFNSIFFDNPDKLIDYLETNMYLV